MVSHLSLWRTSHIQAASRHKKTWKTKINSTDKTVRRAHRDELIQGSTPEFLESSQSFVCFMTFLITYRMEFNTRFTQYQGMLEN